MNPFRPLHWYVGMFVCVCVCSGETGYTTSQTLLSLSETQEQEHTGAWVEAEALL